MSSDRGSTESGSASLEAGATGALLDAMFETREVLLAHLDRDFNFVRVNAAYAEASQQSPAYFVGKSHFALYPHRENEALFRRALETGEHVRVRAKRYEHPHQIDRGATFWDWTAHPIRDASTPTRITGLLLVLKDVTEEVRAHEEARRHAQQFDVLFGTAPDPLFIVQNGYVRRVNEAFVALTQVPREQLEHALLEDVLATCDGPTLERQLLAFAVDPHMPFVPCRMICGDGSGITVGVYGRPIVFGDRAAFMCMARDQREREQLEDELARARRMEAMGRLASGIAHDLNNLLTVITFATSTVRRVGHNPTALAASLEEIDAAVGRASRLSRQFLLFGKDHVPSLESVDVDVLVRDSERVLRRMLGDGVRLELALGAKGARVRGDVTQLEQVLLNLVVNARDAMPKGGVVTIETACADDGSRVVVAVVDTGIGMAPETIERIFEPFFSTKREGTGLGLATVKRIVATHAGTVRVQSELGRGSRFEVALPQLAAGISDSVRPTDALLDEARGDETVLLVDDDDDVRWAARRSLELLGYRVLDTADADGARTLLRAHGDAIQVVVTDLALGGDSGAALGRELRERTPAVPVVVMSGQPADDDERVLDVFLPKPFSPLELARAIRSVLSRHAPA